MEYWMILYIGSIQFSKMSANAMGNFPSLQEYNLCRLSMDYTTVKINNTTILVMIYGIQCENIYSFTSCFCNRCIYKW